MDDSIQHIVFDRVLAAPYDWANYQVLVRWAGETQERRYLLSLTPDADQTDRIRHTTLATSYRATFIGSPIGDSGTNADVVQGRSTNGRSAQDIKQLFILELPNLMGVNAADEIAERTADAERVFAQERDLRERLNASVEKGSPPIRVLPEICSEKLTSIKTDGAPDFPARIPFIARQFIPGLSLRMWAKAYAARQGPDAADFAGILNTEDWFAVARSLLKALTRLHQERVAVGFICPDSVIVRHEVADQDTLDADDMLVFINVGESQPVVYFDEKKLGPFARGHEILPLRRCYDVMENRYRFRRRSPSGWLKFSLEQGSDYYTSTDIFSLGITLAFLATGRDDVVSPLDYVEGWDCGYPGWQIIRGCLERRKYHTTKGKLMTALEEASKRRRRDPLRPHDKSGATTVYEDTLRRAEVILQCARSRTDRRARSISHVMAVLDLFAPSPPVCSSESAIGPSGDQLPSGLQKCVDGLRAASHYSASGICISDVADSLLGAECPKALRRLMADRISRVMEEVKSTTGDSQRFFKVAGSREKLVTSFLNAMSALEPNDECVALTTTAFWNDENFGPSSRTSSMIQLLRLKPVTFTWLLVVRNRDLYMPQVQRVLGFRCVDDQKIRRLSAEIVPASIQRRTLQNAYYYVCVDDDVYEDLLRNKLSFVGVRQANDDGKATPPAEKEATAQPELLRLLIAPDFMARNGAIAALTFWANPKRGERLLDQFNKLLARATPAQYFDRIL